MATQADNSQRLNVNVAAIYTTALEHSPRIRALLRASADEPAVRWYDPAQRLVVGSPDDGTVPVLVSHNEDDAKANRCPACTEDEPARWPTA